MPKIYLKVIPEKCTPIAHPLDTTFHRQLKYLAREVLANLEVFITVNAIEQEENWKLEKELLDYSHFYISCYQLPYLNQ